MFVLKRRSGIRFKEEYSLLVDDELEYLLYWVFYGWWRVAWGLVYRCSNFYYLGILGSVKIIFSGGNSGIK